MNTTTTTAPTLAGFFVIALLILAPGPLAAQSAAAPTDSVSEPKSHRDAALLVDAARPAGAYGLTDATTPQDVWLGAGSKSVKLVLGGLVGLVILRWLWRRRSVRYS